MSRPLPTPLLPWNKIHIANENIYNGNLTKVHYKGNWDFSHLDTSVKALLEANPSCDVYLYGCADVSEPYITAIVIPQGNVPTKMVAYYNKHSGKEEIYPFDHLQYRWVPAEAQEFHNRVYHLVTDADISAAPEEGSDDYYVHEYSSLFTVGPSDLIRRDGKLVIDAVDYSFNDNGGNECDATWDRRDETLNEHLDQVIEGCFPEYDIADDDTDETIKEKTAGATKAKSAVKHKLQIAIYDLRETKEGRINNFFQDVGYGRECLEKIKLVKIFPVNFPNTPKAILADRFYGRFGSPHVITDHFALAAPELAQRLQRALQNEFTHSRVLEKGAASQFGTLGVLLMVDLLERTQYLDQVICLPNLYDKTIALFGEDRILLQLGKDPSSYAFIRPRVKAFVRSLFGELSEVVKSVGRGPTSTLDFVMNFLFSSGVTLDLPDTGYARAVRLSPGNCKKLEISYMGSDEFYPTNVRHLAKFVSKGGIQALLLDILTHPEAGHVHEVPAGSREENELEVNCFKQTLLLAPDHTLSPEGKRRVMKVIPDHEITIPRAKQLFRHSIKTICLSQVKTNIQERAMESSDVMIGVFNDGPRRHCVLIDGSDGAGTIIDPVSSYNTYGSQMRSKRSLSKLHIDEFSSLYTLKRVCLGDKKRKGCEKTLKLPFVKGSRL